MRRGNFNACWEAIYQDGERVIVRFPMLGGQILRREKTMYEATTMKFLGQNSTIAVPEVFAVGMTAMGPYILMSHVRGHPLSLGLKNRRDANYVDPQPKLRRIYYQMAEITLRLSLLEFAAIGSLVEMNGRIIVGKRPITFAMNELIGSCGLPPGVFFMRAYASSDEYFQHLADQHLNQVRLQYSNIVKNEADARRKITARFLFLNLVKTQLHLESPRGPFRLYCEGFCPDKVLEDPITKKVNGTIDWEFAYAAPAEFTYVAPVWLMLENAEKWSSGDLKSSMEKYEPKLATYLEVMAECEGNLIRDGVITEAQRLSGRMKASMENGLFWVCFAARSPSLFDAIYWGYLDERFYGPFTTIEDRILLLSEEQRRGVDALIALKLAEKNGDNRLEDPLPYEDLLKL
ncbi:phosphotransferase enzyme family protein [Aspergillus pseudoustus]|uniref:Phosphotransferase enzyme family protein n=1 Tax=Aspergillus pseudoustus TaxID=1810923 RepID=A0ABR4JNS3_9EURO